MTDALSQSNAWPVVRQCRASREFSFCRLTAPLCSFTRVESCRPVWPTYALGQSEHGMWYTTFRCSGVGRGSFTFTTNVGKHYGSCSGMQMVLRQNSVSCDSDSTMTALKPASFRRRNSCLKTILHEILFNTSRPTYQPERRGTHHTNSRRSSVPKDWGGLQPSARAPHSRGPALPPEMGHNPQGLNFKQSTSPSTPPSPMTQRRPCAHVYTPATPSPLLARAH